MVLEALFGLDQKGVTYLAENLLFGHDAFLLVLLKDYFFVDGF